MHSPTRSFSRRRFLRIGTALGAAAIVPAHVLGLNGAVPPSEKTVMASIGLGGQGNQQMAGGPWSTAGGFIGFKETKFVAVCDVNAQRLEKARQRVNDRYGDQGCKAYKDYREVLGRKDIDAVVIATGERWHPHLSMAAIKAGKAVYSEKPMSVTVAEARALANTVKRYGGVYQLGTQQRSMFKFRQACELVRNGYIGEVKRVLCEVGPGYPPVCNLPGEPVPEWLDWDAWLGPCPWRPFNNRVAFGWMGWFDYSGGDMTNWGAHVMDIVQWGLGADATGPVEIIPPGNKLADDGPGDEQRLRFRYASGAVAVCGGINDPQLRTGSRANIFIGTRGTIKVNREVLISDPPALARQKIGPGEIHLGESDNHHQDFLDAVRLGTKNSAPAESGCRSITVCHIGNIAMYLGRILKWDAAKEEFVGDAEANRMKARALREKWCNV